MGPGCTSQEPHLQPSLLLKPAFKSPSCLPLLRWLGHWDSGRGWAGWGWAVRPGSVRREERKSRKAERDSILWVRGQDLD